MPLFEAREVGLLAPKSEKRAKTGPFLSDYVANRTIDRDRDRAPNRCFRGSPGTFRGGPLFDLFRGKPRFRGIATGVSCT